MFHGDGVVGVVYFRYGSACGIGSKVVCDLEALERLVACVADNNSRTRSVGFVQAGFVVSDGDIAGNLILAAGRNGGPFLSGGVGCGAGSAHECDYRSCALVAIDLDGYGCRGDRYGNGKCLLFTVVAECRYDDCAVVALNGCLPTGSVVGKNLDMFLTVGVFIPNVCTLVQIVSCNYDGFVVFLDANALEIRGLVNRLDIKVVAQVERLNSHVLFGAVESLHDACSDNLGNLEECSLVSTRTDVISQGAQNVQTHERCCRKLRKPDVAVDWTCVNGGTHFGGCVPVNYHVHGSDIRYRGEVDVVLSGLVEFGNICPRIGVVCQISVFVDVITKGLTFYRDE